MTLAYVRLALLVAVWVLLTVSLWRARRWLLFYLVGALGLIVVALLAAITVGWDGWLQALEARQVAALAAALDLELDVTGDAGLAIPNHTGWAVFAVGIECSALLELSAIVGLIVFYPAFSRRRKATTVVVGGAATYLINLVRILIIVAVINALGTDWVFAAHAVIGRIFFFVATIGLLWILVTRPTLGLVGRRLDGGPDGGVGGGVGGAIGGGGGAVGGGLAAGTHGGSDG